MQVDAHIHSSYSPECNPETASPALIMKAGRRRGVDGLCIADHDTIGGYLKAKRVRKDGDPMLVPACEVSTVRGHLLVLGVEREWGEDPDPLDVVDAVRSEAGVVCAPHPFYLSVISVSWLARELKLAVETFNSLASVLIYPNLVAEKFAQKYDLGVTGGSDAHSYDMVGWGLTETEGDDIDDFLSQVKRGNSTAYGTKPPLRRAMRTAYGTALETLRTKLWGG
jgi:predicted metal-dependent phosphoesterase TrpH